MSHREFSDRADKAMREGAIARQAGYSETDCPYKGSNWGVGSYWLIGFRSADPWADEKGKDENI